MFLICLTLVHIHTRLSFTRKWIQKEEKLTLKSRKTLLSLVLLITTSAELEYSAIPLRNQDVPRSSF